MVSIIFSPFRVATLLTMAKTADSDNNLFGRTYNPHKRSFLTAGGSSGGEGALVALRGSILGIGTDIAGSIRIPAFCCGVYGFKPSVGRIPYGGQVSASRPVAPGVAASAGPLANSAEDLHLLLSSVIGAKPWDYDSTALACPWREPEVRKPLTLGFLLEDPSTPISPPIARALKTAVQKIQAAGHNVITLENFPSLEEAGKTCFKFFALDPRRTGLQHIKDGNEPMVNSVAIATKTFGANQPTITMDEYFDINAERRRLKQEWLKIFIDNHLDAVILPAYMTPAPPHDTYGAPWYTCLLNFLDVGSMKLLPHKCLNNQ